MRISDWSSDVCSSDLDVGSFDGGYGSAYLAKMVGQKFAREIFFLGETYTAEEMHQMGAVNKVVDHAEQIGRASCRERVCQYVSISVVAVSLKKKTPKI